MTMILAIALGVSFSANLVAAVMIYRLKKSPPKRMDSTAQDLLHELTHGGAVLRIDVLDKEALFYRRP